MEVGLQSPLAPRAVRFIARLAAIAALAGALRGNARASDFWDEVRTPGLAQHRVHLRRGGAALRENRVELALAEANAAIDACSGCADGYVLRARAFAASSRTAVADEAFEHALGLRADVLDATPEVALVAASCALRSARPERAEGLLMRLLALSRDPFSRARALAMLGDALQLRGPTGLSRAIAVYAEAMHDEESRRTALLGFALALHRRGEEAEALALARRASEAEQNASAPWLPERERAAREALWLSAIGDDAAAAEAWSRASDGSGPFIEHARRARDLARKSSRTHDLAREPKDRRR